MEFGKIDFCLKTSTDFYNFVYDFILSEGLDVG